LTISPLELRRPPKPDIETLNRIANQETIMTTFIQLHLLTFVPPANLNRDDTGAPKTAIVGGDLRLRLSSQSLKRAWRTSDIFEKQLQGHLGQRTLRFGEEIQTRLREGGADDKKALEITRAVIQAFGKPKAETDKSPVYTEQLAFISPAEREAAFALADRIAAGEKFDDKKKIAAEVLKRADTAADIAMFGRMFADHPDFNREAAVQVAHAFTTHRVAVEDDYYTAVDDLNTGVEDMGAGFVGEAGFGSGVFYLYLCIDANLLVANLAGDTALAKAALAALIEAAAKVAPNGKQNSFASRVHTSFLLAEKGSEQPRTLAGAFAKSIKAPDALEASRDGLRKLRQNFAAAYGEGDVTALEMSVEEGKGSLAGIIAFATDWA
jgi:CRISPR system Cascade subunit CasC